MTRQSLVHAVASSLRVDLVKHALSTLDLILLRLEFGLFSLGLLPIFVGNLGKSTSMSLGSPLFFLLDPTLPLVNFFLHVILSLFDE